MQCLLYVDSYLSPTGVYLEYYSPYQDIYMFQVSVSNLSNVKLIIVLSNIHATYRHHPYDLLVHTPYYHSMFSKQLYLAL